MKKLLSEEVPTNSIQFNFGNKNAFIEPKNIQSHARKSSDPP